MHRYPAIVNAGANSLNENSTMADELKLSTSYKPYSLDCNKEIVMHTSLNNIVESLVIIILESGLSLFYFKSYNAFFLVYSIISAHSLYFL